MAVVTNNSENDPLEIMKSVSVDKNEEIESKSPPPKSSNTRDLIRKAREAANQKFAQTINKLEVPNFERKLVLKGEESTAWHGALIKTKLNRPANLAKANKLKNVTKPTIPSMSMGSSGSKCLFGFYKEIRREYEDFREIEASRLQRRLEKLSDFPMESGISNFEGKKASGFS